MRQVEEQLAAVWLPAAPGELRGAVLTRVRRELRAGRWDQRLARTTVILLVLGVALNGGVAFRISGQHERSTSRVVSSNDRPSLLHTAMVVAEVTDAATGRRFAEQLAALSGRVLTADEAAAIDAAMERVGSSGPGNGNKG